MMNTKTMDSVAGGGDIEKRLREMSVDGLERWIVAVNRRRKIAATVAILAVAVALPVVCYACAPAPRYAAYCSTSDAVNINTVRQETIEIFNTFNK